MREAFRTVAPVAERPQPIADRKLDLSPKAVELASWLAEQYAQVDTLDGFVVDPSGRRWPIAETVRSLVKRLSALEGRAIPSAAWQDLIDFRSAMDDPQSRWLADAASAREEAIFDAG